MPFTPATSGRLIHSTAPLRRFSSLDNSRLARFKLIEVRDHPLDVAEVPVWSCLFANGSAPAPDTCESNREPARTLGRIAEIVTG